MRQTEVHASNGVPKAKRPGTPSTLSKQMHSMLTPAQLAAVVHLRGTLLQPLDEIQRVRANFFGQPLPRLSRPICVAQSSSQSKYK